MRVLESPIYINWNFTYRCNFSCKHCYSRDEEYPEELSSEDYIKICNKIADSNVFQVNLGGGEPILREDIFQVIKELSSRGIKVNLTTNGWLTSEEEVLKKLKDSGLSSLFVSLDHIFPEEHDDFRNRPGSFEKAIKCIDTALKNEIDVYLSIVVTSRNLNFIEKIAEFANQKGVKGLDIKRFRPQGKGSSIEEEYSIPLDSEDFLIKSINSIKESFSFKVFFLYKEKGIDNLDEGCPCGRVSLALLPNGDIAPCVYNQVIIGNVLNQSIGELWRGKFLTRFRDNFKCIGNMDTETLKKYLEEVI